MKQVPNLLTLARIAVIVPIVLLFHVEAAWADWTILGLFLIAGVSDYLDGFLARRYASVSRLGRCLDPIADKLLVTALLLMLAGTGRLDTLSLWCALLILLREITVSGLREYLAGQRTIPVTPLAKWKTAAQFVALAFLILSDQPDWGPAVGSIGTGALAVAAALTIITGWDYVRSMIDDLIYDGPSPRP